jgi:hypothetical protein
MSWSRAFDDPMELPDGRMLRTLRDAGHYVTALSKADQAKQELAWTEKSGMARERRTMLGTLLDHDKAARYDRAKMLFTLCWLERHPLVKWLLEISVDKPWRTKKRSSGRGHQG